MSLSTEENKKQYDGNDSTTIFPFPYLFQANTDLTVIHTSSSGEDTILVLDTDYSVSGADNPAGGSVTYPIAGTPLETGEKITIAREMEVNQETDLSNHGAFFLVAIENALDKLAMIAQQLKEMYDRTVKVDITDTDDPPSVTEYNSALATVQALEAAFDNLVVQNHSALATASQTVFTMPGAWPDLDATSNVTVYDDGLKIDRDDYSVTADDEITFDTGRAEFSTIIFELHEALSSDDLDAAILDATSFNVVIHSNPNKGNYTTLAAYIADSPASGDHVWVRTNEVLSATLVIPVFIHVHLDKGVSLNVETNFSPIMQFSGGITVTGKITIRNSDVGTIAKGVLFSGSYNVVFDLEFLNSNGGTITNAVEIAANQKGNYCNGVVDNLSGTITTIFNDLSTENNNDVKIRDDNGGIYRSNGAKTFRQIHQNKGADIVSAEPLVLGSDGNYFDITVGTNISSIATLGVGTEVTLHFDGELTIVHHATNLILPDGLNILTRAGDEFTFREYASGDWRLVSGNWLPEQRSIGTLADDATPSIFGRDRTFLTGGTTTITDFDGGAEGQIIRIIAEHSITITENANIFLSGSVDFDMTATDTLTLIQKADGNWYELARGDNGA